VILLSYVDECEVDKEVGLASYSEQTLPERVGCVGRFDVVSPLGY